MLPFAFYVGYGGFYGWVLCALCVCVHVYVHVCACAGVQVQVQLPVCALLSFGHFKLGGFYDFLGSFFPLFPLFLSFFSFSLFFGVGEYCMIRYVRWG